MSIWRQELFQYPAAIFVGTVAARFHTATSYQPFKDMFRSIEVNSVRFWAAAITTYLSGFSGLGYINSTPRSAPAYWRSPMDISPAENFSGRAGDICRIREFVSTFPSRTRCRVRISEGVTSLSSLYGKSTK